MSIVNFIIKIFRDIGLRVIELVKTLLAFAITGFIILLIIGLIIKLSEDS